jgi:hypothetical protein
MIQDHENVARARLRIKALEGQAARMGMSTLHSPSHLAKAPS